MCNGSMVISQLLIIRCVAGLEGQLLLEQQISSLYIMFQVGVIFQPFSFSSPNYRPLSLKRNRFQTLSRYYTHFKYIRDSSTSSSQIPRHIK